MRASFFVTFELPLTIDTSPATAGHDKPATPTFLFRFFEGCATRRTRSKLQISCVTEFLGSLHLKFINFMIDTPSSLKVLVPHIDGHCSPDVMG